MEYWVEPAIGQVTGKRRYKVMARFDDGCVECVDDFFSEREAVLQVKLLTEEIDVYYSVSA